MTSQEIDSRYVFGIHFGVFFSIQNSWLYLGAEPAVGLAIFLAFAFFVASVYMDGVYKPWKLSKNITRLIVHSLSWLMIMSYFASFQPGWSKQMIAYGLSALILIVWFALIALCKQGDCELSKYMKNFRKNNH